ncbi:L-type lectin-domain containing receptor kinase IX.1-like [Curcuma longa]|uniref:L-type lectin-domain containing receptor kinase IX.1-like n=1 Tax=Curcuma longa TaxID=136217 RepID=UPI003D9E19EB
MNFSSQPTRRSLHEVNVETLQEDNSTILLKCLLQPTHQSSSFESEPAINFAGNRSGGSLQLTDGGPAASATAYYAYPIPLWRAATNETTNFSTYFEFSVSFPSGGATNSSPFGGFAFFLAPIDSFDHGTSNPIDLSNGTSTSPDFLLAVEFDSFRASSISNGTAAASNDTLAARVSYNAISKILAVHVEELKASPNSSSLNLTHQVDVRQVLPDQVLVGFSATNGSAAVLQRITRWNFTSDLELERKKFTLKLWMVASVVGLILALFLVALILYIWRGEGSLRTKILYWIILSLEKGVTFARLPLLWCRLMRRRSKGEDSNLSLGESMDDEFSTGTGPRRFSYRELAVATNNFSEKRKLGEGGFGGVYKGFLSRSGIEVAVKKISSASKQGRKEYASEVKIISRLRHRNLVQLLGWCHERGEFLLVYEFLPNGSLDRHLFRRQTSPSLPWEIRYNVAVGLAKALLYLHEEWEQCVVHRDIKPSNVMLDSSFNAKLGDFGLARLVDHQQGQHATGVAGTLGYLAPECFHTGKASKESDVYSFGVVALEIATGRRAVEHNKEAEEEVRLLEWVWDMNGQGRLMEAADRRLEAQFEEAQFEVQMERLMLVGLWCAHPDQAQRPSMREAIQALRFEATTIPSLPKTLPLPVFEPLVPAPQGSMSSTPTNTFGSLTTGR